MLALPLHLNNAYESNEEAAKKFHNILVVKWDASSRWSFGPNFAWGSIETTAIGKSHPSLCFQTN